MNVITYEVMMDMFTKTCTKCMDTWDDVVDKEKAEALGQDYSDVKKATFMASMALKHIIVDIFGYQPKEDQDPSETFIDLDKLGLQVAALGVCKTIDIPMDDMFSMMGVTLEQTPAAKKALQAFSKIPSVLVAKYLAILLSTQIEPMQIKMKNGQDA